MNTATVGACLLAVAFLLAVGCGTGQAVISAQARTIVEHQPERFAFYEQLDERCFQQHAEDRGAYRVCMAPARHIARTADSYREALHAAQSALDASGEEDFEAMLPDLVRAAYRLATALQAANVPVPRQVVDVLSLGESL